MKARSVDLPSIEFMRDELLKDHAARDTSHIKSPLERRMICDAVENSIRTDDDFVKWAYGELLYRRKAEGSQCE